MFRYARSSVFGIQMKCKFCGIDNAIDNRKENIKSLVIEWFLYRKLETVYSEDWIKWDKRRNKIERGITFKNRTSLIGDEPIKEIRRWYKLRDLFWQRCVSLRHMNVSIIELRETIRNLISEKILEEKKDKTNMYRILDKTK